MKVCVLDITSRNPNQYDSALCNALVGELSIGSKVTLISTLNHGDSTKYGYFGLLNLIPAKYRAIDSKWKRALRAVEVCLNYLIVVFYVGIRRPDILHIQWLPLVDICCAERYILGLIKRLSPKTRIFLTVHNIFPHNIKEAAKLKYRKRFLQVSRHINGFFVHLNSTKLEFSDYYGIPLEKIHLAYHGIYIPDGYVPHPPVRNDKIRLIMYGAQSKYKGTDILINALKLLPQEKQNMFKTTIVGKTDESLLKECSPYCKQLNIKWDNRFVSDEELYNYIGASDIIALPYRAISQSGVLLLALSFKKPILASDLPSFKETLEGFSSDMFFKPEDSQSLAEVLLRYANGEIDISKQLAAIDKLNKKYSWQETAKSTIQGYMVANDFNRGGYKEQS